MIQDAPLVPDQEDFDAAKEGFEGAAEVGKQIVEETDWTAFLSDWRFRALIALVGVLVVIWGYRKVRRTIRRARGPKLHPLLQKYSGQPDPKEEKLVLARRKEAERIVATSSSGMIVGYEIIEQVEAVYVDGFRRPEEATEGLKAAAAMKGANAVINVHQERSAAGRCSAHGDAVVVVRPGQPAMEPEPADAAEAEASAPEDYDDPITPSGGDEAVA